MRGYVHFAPKESKGRSCKIPEGTSIHFARIKCAESAPSGEIRKRRVRVTFRRRKSLRQFLQELGLLRERICYRATDAARMCALGKSRRCRDEGAFFFLFFFLFLLFFVFVLLRIRVEQFTRASSTSERKLHLRQ